MFCSDILFLCKLSGPTSWWPPGQSKDVLHDLSGRAVSHQCSPLHFHRAGMSAQAGAQAQCLAHWCTPRLAQAFLRAQAHHQAQAYDLPLGLCRQWQFMVSGTGFLQLLISHLAYTSQCYLLLYIAKREQLQSPINFPRRKPPDDPADGLRLRWKMWMTATTANPSKIRKQWSTH